MGAAPVSAIRRRCAKQHAIISRFHGGSETLSAQAIEIMMPRGHAKAAPPFDRTIPIGQRDPVDGEERRPHRNAEETRAATVGRDVSVAAGALYATPAGVSVAAATTHVTPAIVSVTVATLHVAPASV